jgi:Ca2+-binding EF-hand superfamily protein
MLRFAKVLLASAVLAVARADEELEDMDDAVDAEDPTQMLMKQAEDDFKSMDMDHDGKLSESDLKQYLNDPAMDSEITEFLTKADTDKDGFINKDEYMAFIQSVIANYHGGEDEFEDDEEAETDLDSLDDDEEL